MALLVCACANVLGFEEGKPRESGSGGSATANASATASANTTTSSTGGQAGGGPSYFDVVMADAPCGYWRLGEAMGAVASDASSNGIDGTYFGVILGASGALAGDADTAAAFDGVAGTKLVIDSDAFRFPGTAPFSVELWVKPPTLAGGFPTVIGKFEDLGSVMNGWWIYAKTDSTVFWREDGVASDGVSGPALTPGAFTHLVATFDGVNMRLYLNAAIVDDRTSSLQIGEHQQPLVVGSRYNDNAPFAGTIDEVAIYCTALSAGDVLEHYQVAIP